MKENLNRNCIGFPSSNLSMKKDRVRIQVFVCFVSCSLMMWLSQQMFVLK